MFRQFALILLLIAWSLGFVACHSDQERTTHVPKDTAGDIATVADIPIISGGVREPAPSGSWAHYLQHLPLKPQDYPVHLWNGKTVPDRAAHMRAYRVVNMDIDPQDLQQCADAIIRLRAEWLYGLKRYCDIKFHFTNGFVADYDKWAHGYRIRLNPEQTHCTWYRANTDTDYSYATFRQYLLTVFTYAGTASLYKELAPVEGEARAGDVLIHPGFPGHAAVIVDHITYDDGKRHAYLLAQSWMPAREIAVYPAFNWATGKGETCNQQLFPYYDPAVTDSIHTRSYPFDVKRDLRRFKD